MKKRRWWFLRALLQVLRNNWIPLGLVGLGVFLEIWGGLNRSWRKAVDDQPTWGAYIIGVYLVGYAGGIWSGRAGTDRREMREHWKGIRDAANRAAQASRIATAPGSITVSIQAGAGTGKITSASTAAIQAGLRIRGPLHEQPDKPVQVVPSRIPQICYRSWILPRSFEVLGSRHVSSVWPIGRGAVAECQQTPHPALHPEPAPHEPCHCGLYGLFDLWRVLSLENQAEDSSSIVVGAVELYGRVVVGEAGVRAEKARVIALLQPREGSVENLARMYDAKLCANVMELQAFVEERKAAYALADLGKELETGSES